jgi:hypothetical protein
MVGGKRLKVGLGQNARPYLKNNNNKKKKPRDAGDSSGRRPA